MKLGTEYKKLMTNIKQKVKEAQLKTVVAANSQMLFLYWQLGNYILENQSKEGWGTKIISLLSNDLKIEFPDIKGFSERNLKYMRSFAYSYLGFVLEKMIEFEDNKNNSLFLQSIVSRIQWSHHVNLIDKEENLGKRFWYMLNTIEHGISRNILAMQIAGY